MAVSKIKAVTLLAMVLLSCVSCFPQEIRRQNNILKNLTCEPKAMAVSVSSITDFSNDVTDKTYFPQVVAVNRCLQDCSFCGNHFTGEKTGTCVPDETGNHTVVVSYKGEGGRQLIQKIPVLEHKTCKCEAL